MKIIYSIADFLHNHPWILVYVISFTIICWLAIIAPIYKEDEEG